MMRSILVLLVTLFFVGCSAQNEKPFTAADNVRAGQAHTSSAFEALGEEDFETFLSEMQAANEYRPLHPSLMLHLARAYVLTGDTESAIEVLTQLSETGMSVGLERPAFEDLAADSRFQQITDRIAENANPVVRSDTVFQGSDANFQPEGIERIDGRWLFGSVHQNRVAWEAATSLIESDDMWSGMGMQRSGNFLWVASTATAEGGADELSIGSSKVMRVILSSPNLISSYAPADTLDHWFGDLVVSDSGKVYISDSQAPGIYSVTKTGFRRLITGDPFTSPQGIALLDGKLYLADYSAGVFEVDLETKEARLLQAPEGAVLLGIDGLEVHGSDLIAIQNGTNPTRVLRIHLGLDGNIESVDVLEQRHPAHSDPTLGIVRNDTLFYLANSQWPLFSEGADESLRKAPIVLGLPLSN